MGYSAVSPSPHLGRGAATEALRTALALSEMPSALPSRLQAGSPLMPRLRVSKSGLCVQDGAMVLLQGASHSRPACCA